MVAFHQDGEHQSGVIRATPAKYSVTPVRRTAAMTAVGTHATCRDEVLRTAFGGKPENIYSL
jgi:hypothetical protein